MKCIPLAVIGLALFAAGPSDNGGTTAAVLLSFIAMCKRNAVEPFTWSLPKILLHAESTASLKSP